MATPEEPLFNLKAVVQQTGLKPDTLRAWERRYGLPVPRRSSGGHRLFSQRDIDTIQWLMARQREGLSIKRAVQLWQQLAAGGQDPLGALTPVTTPPTATPTPRTEGETIVQLREEWFAACLAYDERRAEQALSQAFALYPPETVCLELLQKAMVQVGEGWYRGEVTVQQEHFCSGLATRRLEALVMATPPPTRPGRILAACPPQEDHVFGLLLLTYLLRRRGWAVVYLGANVPVERLETTMATANPQLVILAAQQLYSAATLLRAAQLSKREGIPPAYGGRIFNLLPALRSRVPGYFLGDDLRSAPNTVEMLMATPRPLPAVEAIPEASRQARDHFRERQGLIEAQLVQALGPMGMTPNYLAIANRELALDIGAACSPGDIEFLGTDFNWIRGLLRNHHLPVETLRHYLSAYHQAARDHMDERGEPIVTWLDGAIHENGRNES